MYSTVFIDMKTGEANIERSDFGLKDNVYVELSENICLVGNTRQLLELADSVVAFFKNERGQARDEKLDSLSAQIAGLQGYTRIRAGDRRTIADR